MSTFQEAVRKRRSIYKIGTKVILSHNEIKKLVECCLFNAPSAFNAQSARTVLLFGNSNQKFWDMVIDTLKVQVPTTSFPKTKEKIQSFAAGIGTVLFFEDEKTLKKLQTDFPTYSDNFPKWAEQGNGILQYMVWTGFSENGIGASIQHYNPLIDEQTAKIFKISDSWRLIAQMPFGSIEGAAGVKTHLPLDERIKVFK